MKLVPLEVWRTFVYTLRTVYIYINSYLLAGACAGCSHLCSQDPGCWFLIVGDLTLKTPCWLNHSFLSLQKTRKRRSIYRSYPKKFDDNVFYMSAWWININSFTFIKRCHMQFGKTKVLQNQCGLIVSYRNAQITTIMQYDSNTCANDLGACRRISLFHPGCSKMGRIIMI